MKNEVFPLPVDMCETVELSIKSPCEVNCLVPLCGQGVYTLRATTIPIMGMETPEGPQQLHESSPMTVLPLTIFLLMMFTVARGGGDSLASGPGYISHPWSWGNISYLQRLITQRTNQDSFIHVHGLTKKYYITFMVSCGFSIFKIFAQFPGYGSNKMKSLMKKYKKISLALFSYLKATKVMPSLTQEKSKERK